MVQYHSNAHDNEIPIFKCYFYFRFRLETIDGSAVEGEDYEPLNEILTFEPNEKEKEVSCLFKPNFYLNLGLKQSFWKLDSQH